MLSYINCFLENFSAVVRRNSKPKPMKGIRKVTICAALLLVLVHQAFSAPGPDSPCGICKYAGGLSYGATKGQRGQFPWLVAVFDKQNRHFICAGSLVSRRHIITGAHCLQPKGQSEALKKETIYVHQDRFDLSDEEETFADKKFDVEKIIIHPDWTVTGRSYDADIAIIVLEREVTFRANVQKVCLPSADHGYVEKGNVVS